MADRHFPMVSVLMFLAAALAAGAAVVIMPDALIRWIPAIVGTLWTVALVWFGRRLGRSGAGAASLRSGAIACGLLTLVAASAGLRGRVGWPELVLIVPALLALGWWARATLREIRLRRRLPPTPPRPVLGLGEDERRPGAWH